MKAEASASPACLPGKRKTPAAGLLKLFFGGLLPCGDVGTDKLLDVAGCAGHAFKHFEHVVSLRMNQTKCDGFAALFQVFVLCGVACALFVVALNLIFGFCQVLCSCSVPCRMLRQGL